MVAEAKAPLVEPAISEQKEIPLPPEAGSIPEEVTMVRNGVLPAYQSTTLGKALEGTFQNAHWSMFESAKGATIVQFKGGIAPQALKSGGFDPHLLIDGLLTNAQQRCVETAKPAPADSEPLQPSVPSGDKAAIAECIAEVKKTFLVPVTFQFKVSVDRTSFEVSFIDMEPFYKPGDAIKVDSEGKFVKDPEEILAFIYR